MRLLFVVDGRSPISLNWINYFVENGHDVHLASTFPCEPDLSFASLTFVPVAFSGTKVKEGSKTNRSWVVDAISGASYVNLRTSIRQKVGPLTLNRAKPSLQRIINRVNPDLVHAMRIPYEGMLAAVAFRDLVDTHKKQKRPPLLISVWGNDFTLHALSSFLMKHYTHETLSTADALHTDCLRDQRLAYEWGFPRERPAVVLPGGGGVKLDIFSPPTLSETLEENVMRVINPRGVRAYIRNDVFFEAAKLVLMKNPTVRFICTGMADEPQIEAIVNELGLSSKVELLPKVPYVKMPELFKSAQIAVSPSTHDGTPNTLLEAMACGCFPIAGDIESVREWITPGKNGFLVNPIDPYQLAEAIDISLHDSELRSKAAQYNTQLIEKKASYQVVMKHAEEFYRLLINVYNEKRSNV
jgi:glycosyltransferase involved in cell wall biosynthesis